MKQGAVNPNTLLVVAVLGGAALAFGNTSHGPGTVSDTRSSPSEPAATEAPPPSDVAPPLADALFDDDGSEDDGEAEGLSVSGKVLEALDVEKYSYLRLSGAEEAGVWAAVPRTSNRLGTEVVVRNAVLMTSFASPQLKRTFERIYFGVLEDAAEPGAEAAPGRDTSLPHPGAGKGADGVPVGKIVRAAGALGHTIAELNEHRVELAGKRARVRGVVVKSTPGVMGHTFLHLRDGSGNARDGSNDLAVTSSGEPAVGSELELEGTVNADRDFGAGYHYAVLLADATPVGE